MTAGTTPARREGETRAQAMASERNEFKAGLFILISIVLVVGGVLLR